MNGYTNKEHRVLGFSDKDVILAYSGSAKECFDYCKGHSWEINKDGVVYSLSLMEDKVYG